MPEKFFATRHSIKPKGEDLPSQKYQGISEKGVELAKERATELLADLQQEKPGTVMLLGAVSNQIRTKSTAEVYGDELKDLVEQKGIIDVMVFDRNDFDTKEGQNKKVDWLVKQIQDNADKKVMIDFPMFIKEFALNNNTWFTKEGNLTAYAAKLLEKNNNDEQAALRDWLDNQGQLDNLVGPKPQEIAEKQLQGIKRLSDFVHKFLPDREVIIGAVGHSWNLDVLAVYLGNKGKVDVKGYDKLGGQMITETQPIKLLTEDNKDYLLYGDNKIKLD
ncbi:MAG: hypothetical protein WCW02_02735 [Candidatus Buchananbacteria bacterium]